MCIRDRLRVAELWKHILEFYRDNQISDRLPTITDKMIQKDGSPPKLRASAACARALVPFAKKIADEYLSDADPMEQAAKIAAGHLLKCYETLSHTSIFHTAVLQEHSTMFAIQYKGLSENSRGMDWKVKPKMHLWLELCSEGSQPSTFWCYRDEDYGGTVAHLARRRGGCLLYTSPSPRDA